MASPLASFAILYFILLLLFINPAEILKTVNGQDPGQGQHRTWCIAKPSTSEKQLNDNIAYVCQNGGVSCDVISYGGPCFYPNTTINHASVAMNLYYQKNGRNYWNCDFGNSGVCASSDPSYGDCKM